MDCAALDSRRTMCNSCRSTVLPPYRPARLKWRVPAQLGRREYAARLRDQHFCSNRGYFEHLRRIDRIWRSKVPLIQRRDENREQPAKGSLRISTISFANPRCTRKAPEFSGAFSCSWWHLQGAPPWSKGESRAFEREAAASYLTGNNPLSASVVGRNLQTGRHFVGLDQEGEDAHG